MSGKFLVIGLLGFPAIFGAFLWYAQFYAYYDEVWDIEQIDVAGRSIAVQDYYGLDGTSSGLKLRGCFTLDPTELADVALANDPVPITPPNWFECFDTEQLTHDIENGVAIAYLAKAEDRDGLDRVVAVYPDGRAFMWRQLNGKYQE